MAGGRVARLFDLHHLQRHRRIQNRRAALDRPTPLSVAGLLVAIHTRLGKIQGAAQTLTVLASAIGPLLLAECVTRTGSYAVIFYLLAAVVSVLGIAAWFAAIPSPKKSGGTDFFG